MAGFDLKEGEYIDRDVSEDELWSTFAKVFSSASRNDSSYKFGFLKSIIAELDNLDKNLILTFDQVFARFTAIYWVLILKYYLKQKAATSDNRKSVIERVIQDASDKYCHDEYVPFESLPYKAKQDITHNVKMKGKAYVIGALFDDTDRLFYSFSKKGEWIKLNPRMYDFLCHNKNEIEKLNNIEWAYFLEKVNKGTNANQILTRCLKNIDSERITDTDTAFGVNESTYKSYEDMDQYGGLPAGGMPVEEVSEKEIDNEAMALLDNPEALIKHLKKKKGI